MTPTVFFILLAAIALGVILILWGRRGKRLNKSPTCRDCRFDLTGVYPESITCPECGGGLNRRKAVRMGARRKRWIPITLGLVLVLLPGATLGLATFAALTGQDINDYKPLGLLLWEGEHGSAELVQSSGEYLLKQYEDGLLDTQRLDEISNAALRIQGNARRPWHTSWGDIIERACLDGTLSDDDHARFLQQAAVVSISTRESLPLDRPIPILVKLDHWRVGRNSRVYVTLHAESCEITGDQIPTPRHIGWVRPEKQDGILLGSFQIVGGQSQTAAFSTRAFRSLISSPHLSNLSGLMPTDDSDGTILQIRDLSPRNLGRHTFDLNIRMRSHASRNARRFNQQTQPREGVLTKQMLLTNVRRSADMQIRKTSSPDSRARLMDKLTPRSVVLTDFHARERPGMRPRPLPPADYKPDPLTLTIDFPTFDPKVDLAFDVIVEQSGRRWTVGALVSKPHMDVGSVAYIHSKIRTVRVDADLPGFERAPFTLYLVPSTAVAMGTMEIESIFGEELVYKDVQFKWNDPQSLAIDRETR